MGNKRIDPQQQFSKKLAKWTSVFWFLYMTWLSVILVLQPSAAMYSFYMSIVASAVMIVNVYSYLKNSLGEKALLTLLDKTKLELMTGKEGDADEKEVSNG